MKYIVTVDDPHNDPGTDGIIRRTLAENDLTVESIYTITPIDTAPRESNQ